MKLYVGNLSKEITEPALRESFEKYGEIISLNIVMDKYTRKPKGFAFIEMADEYALEAITGLHGQNLAGNLLNVNKAR